VPERAPLLSAALHGDADAGLLPEPGRRPAARQQGLPGVLRAAPHPAPRARRRHGGAPHGDGHRLRLPEVPEGEGAREEGHEVARLAAPAQPTVKISQRYAEGRPVVSFEFFPPATAAGEDALMRTIDALRPLGPRGIRSAAAASAASSTSR